MRFLKRWFFTGCLVLFGILYLGMVDNWQLYTAPATELGELCRRLILGTAGEQSQAPSQAIEESDLNLEFKEHLESEKQPDISGTEEGAKLENAGAQGADSTKDDIQKAETLFCTVEDDYFSDALFIGDSRTVGMYEYGGLEEIATFYASTGLSVYKLMSAEIVDVPGQKKKVSVREGLQKEKFAKIYLMVGINEMGTGTVEKFIDKYEEILKELQELQPEAILYVQGIMKVTSKRSNQGDYITNEGIEERNEGLKSLADGERIFYLDVNPLIVDESGGMTESYTFDGVHLKAQYVEIWKDYLKCHAICP